MIRTTPFHERTSVLNETGLWQHWSGHVVVTRYQASDKFEYFAVRNSAGISTPRRCTYRIAAVTPSVPVRHAARDIPSLPARETPSTRHGSTSAASSSMTADPAPLADGFLLTAAERTSPVRPDPSTPGRASRRSSWTGRAGGQGTRSRDL